MIKVLTVKTNELDNSEKAVKDILTQLDMGNNLLKNTVGLLFCHIKFIEMGLVETLCGKLPFEVLGCTSMFFAVSAAGKPAEEGVMALTLTVLTSDNIEFATGVCDPLTEANAEDCINAMYQKTVSSLGGAADLVFAFPPTLFNLPIDILTGALNRACGGIPVFGTVALDVDTRIRAPHTIYRGAAYTDRIPILLFKGPVRPKFFSLRFPEKSILAQDAVITSAEGPRLITINNEPAASFLKELGLIQDNQGGFAPAIPMVIESVDGSKPAVVVVQNITPDGTLICGRHIPVGGILNIGAIGANYVLESAKTLFRNIKEDGGGGTWLFVISCFLRTVVLGEGATAEVAVMRQELDSFPGSWLYINSGGELCPKYTESGETENQALQYAIIACQL
jgi:hypothetical protein